MQSILELTDYHLLKTFNNKDSKNEALYNIGYKDKLDYLDANKHYINKGNNIGNKGHNYRETMEVIM